MKTLIAWLIIAAAVFGVFVLLKRFRTFGADSETGGKVTGETVSDGSGGALKNPPKKGFLGKGGLTSIAKSSMTPPLSFSYRPQAFTATGGSGPPSSTKTFTTVSGVTKKF